MIRMRSMYLLLLNFVAFHLYIYSDSASTGVSSLTVSRITSELKEVISSKLSLDIPFNLSSNDESGVRLSPLKSNLLEWHFTFTGVNGSQYEGGLYHGKIKLHPDYPRKAPAISVSTPNGRWEIDKDICLSASSYHQETWNPNWNLRTLVMSLRAFMTTQPREIGAIFTSIDQQISLSKISRGWYCRHCGMRHSSMLPHTDFLIGDISNMQTLYLGSNWPTTANMSVIVKSKKKHKNRNLSRSKSSNRVVGYLVPLLITAFLIFNVLKIHIFSLYNIFEEIS
eukprot:gene10241-13775_t